MYFWWWWERGNACLLLFLSTFLLSTGTLLQILRMQIGLGVVSVALKLANFVPDFLNLIKFNTSHTCIQLSGFTISSFYSFLSSLLFPLLLGRGRLPLSYIIKLWKTIFQCDFLLFLQPVSCTRLVHTYLCVPKQEVNYKQGYLFTKIQ